MDDLTRGASGTSVGRFSVSGGAKSPPISTGLSPTELPDFQRRMPHKLRAIKGSTQRATGPAAFALTTLLSAWVSSCGTDNPSANGRDDAASITWPSLGAETRRLQFTLPAEPFSGEGSAGPSEVVMGTREEWADFWSKFAKAYSPTPPTPTIDFSTQMVLAYSIGLKGTSGYSLFAEGVYETASNVVVRIEQTVPAVGCPASTVINSPVLVLATERSPKPVEFHVMTKPLGCGSPKPSP